MTTRPNISVTFVIEYRGKFLLTGRGTQSTNFPDLWAFPGGKVELHETLIEAVRREVIEETALALGPLGAFLDTYWFGSTVGAAFLVQALSDKVVLSSDLFDCRWVASLDDLKSFRCVPGIHNHLARAKQVIARGELVDLDELNLTSDKYINLD